MQYRLAGVDKDEATRTKIKELQDKTTLLSLTFGRNVQENVNRVQVSNKSELEGLPEDFINAHPPDEHGLITLTTDYPDLHARHDLRERRTVAVAHVFGLQHASLPGKRGDIARPVKDPATNCKYPRFETWADLATADQMMASATNLKSFLDDLDKAQNLARNESMRLSSNSRASRSRQWSRLTLTAGLTGMSSTGGRLITLIRSRCDLISPTDLWKRGVLETAEKLFQVTFRPAKHADVWHESVSAWDVYDGLNSSVGSKIGRFYLDMHPREGKDKWFSAHPLIPGIAGKQVPEAALICNFPEAKEGNPGLMQYSDVVTFFHEFGHLMQRDPGRTAEVGGCKRHCYRRRFR